MAISIVVIAFLSIAFPLTRVVKGDTPQGSPVVAVSEGMNSTVQSQVQSVAATLVSATPTAGSAASPETAAIDESLEGLPAGALVPKSVLKTAASLLVQGALASPEGEQVALDRQEPVRFTLHDEDLPVELFSTRQTVGAALTALGTDYTPHDIVSPSPDATLTARTHVFVARAIEVSLKVGSGDKELVYTHADTVADLLSERGVTLSKLDSVKPAAGAELKDGLAVVVTVVEEATEDEEIPLPFETIYVDDPTLTEGDSIVSQYGVDGYVLRHWKVVYKNGEEVSRELVSEETYDFTYQIVAVGTAPVAVAAAVTAPPPATDPDCPRTLTVWATWYNAASAGDSTTATGTTVRKGTVAVDPGVIPLGTQMYIPGYGYGWAEDTGGAVRGNIIDLGYGPNDVLDWTSRYVDICILN
jgi:uncharacterized protein YabE (DUF348 family)/3D (Asp-Asp-Asp) domain-containing protein